MSNNFRPIKKQDVRYRTPYFLVCVDCGEKLTAFTEGELVRMANAYGWRCDENESPPRVLCNCCAIHAKEHVKWHSQM